MKKASDIQLELAQALKRVFGTTFWFSSMDAKKALGRDVVDLAKLQELRELGLLDSSRALYGGPVSFKMKE